VGFGVIDVSICVEHVFFVDIIFKNPVFRQNTETTMTKARLLFFAQFLETSSFLLGSMGALISQLPDSKLSRSYHEALMSLIPKGRVGHHATMISPIGLEFSQFIEYLVK
jgi:hypothetical protein